LTTKKVSSIIDGYKQQLNDIKTNYLVQVTADSRFAMSEMQDELSTTVKSEAHRIQCEIRSLGDNQKEDAAQICKILQDMKGHYKGQLVRVSVVFIKHVYILFAGPRNFTLRHQDRRACASFKA
jgi:hypothetical protein